jgi:hypothetical protein
MPLRAYTARTCPAAPGKRATIGVSDWASGTRLRVQEENQRLKSDLYRVRSELAALRGNATDDVTLVGARALCVVRRRGSTETGLCVLDMPPKAAEIAEFWVAGRGREQLVKPGRQGCAHGAHAERGAARGSVGRRCLRRRPAVRIPHTPTHRRSWGGVTPRVCDVQRWKSGES